jgi:hypothetical protein
VRTCVADVVVCMSTWRRNESVSDTRGIGATDKEAKRPLNLDVVNVRFKTKDVMGSFLQAGKESI